jgi:hypothetical protein
MIHFLMLGSRLTFTKYYINMVINLEANRMAGCQYFLIYFP